MAATALISLVVYEYFTSVLPWLLNADSASGGSVFSASMWTALGLFIGTNIVFNHQSCVWTSPGYSPLSIDKYPKQFQHQPSQFYKLDPELKSSDVIRYCNQCQCYKSWRAHHCSICKRCVLKMDHHCPWMWNCVGYANYRYFFMFLFYLWLGTLFYVWMGYEALFQSFRVKSCAYPWLPFFLCRISRVRHKLPPTDALVDGVSFHAYLVLTNQSTLETMTNHSKSARARRRWSRLRDEKYVYHLGVMENIKEFCGERWYLALLPVWTKPRGNGYIYKLRPEIHAIVHSAQSPLDAKQMTQP